MQSKMIESALLIFFLISFAVGGTDRVQTALIHFKDIGKVQVKAEVPIGTPPRLIFNDARTGHHLKTVPVRDLDDLYFFTKRSSQDPYPKLRFRVLNVAGLPDPLVLAVAMVGGGSDCTYQPVVVASVSGRVTPLLPKPTMFTTQDAIVLGNLGNNRGYGFAVVKNVWAEGEVHYQQHRFTIEFFRWNEKIGAFENAGRFTTKTETDANGAATEARIPRDQVITLEKLLKWFPDFGC